MKTLKDEKHPAFAKGSVVTLGNFDGVHAGHARILRKLVARARRLGLPSIVYTFDPHPKKVVSPEKCPPLITTTDKKLELIGSLGIDYVVLARFTRGFADRHPREFVESVLAKGLKSKEVWVGHDYGFGKGKTGSVDCLKRLGRRNGFDVHIVPAHRRRGRVASSSLVRELVTKGRVGEARVFLGRAFSISGRVIRGADMGKTIGYPTANLDVETELVPADGVYAAEAVVRGRRFPAVANIGTRPTFNGERHGVETHVMGLGEDIYGKRIEVFFIRRLRSERRFKTVGALKTRIAADIKRTEKILKTRPLLP